MTVSPLSTVAVSFTGNFVIFPLIGILISFCIFIASIIHAVSPASRISPTLTLILAIIPASGAVIIPSGSADTPLLPDFF